jgi:Na+/H+-dicarboxylate symporter
MICSPSTLGFGIVFTATAVQNLGVPATGISLILGVDRILDMSRTAFNVTGDLTACLVMSRLLHGKNSRQVQLSRPLDLVEGNLDVGLGGVEETLIK